jgi:hypothetical protein
MKVIDKLIREWKTFALAVATTGVGVWDVASSSGYDLSPIVPETYRPYAVPAIGISFLLLRKYTDNKKVSETVETKTVEKTDSDA